MRRENLVKGLGCLLVGATVLVSNPAPVYAEEGFGSEVENTTEPQEYVRKIESATLNIGDTLTPEAFLGSAASSYDFNYGFPTTVYTEPGIYTETVYATDSSERVVKFEVTVIIKSGNNTFTYDEKNHGYGCGSVTGKVIIDGVEHYIDSGYFTYKQSTGSEGKVCLHKSFLEDILSEISYNKEYDFVEKKITVNGETTYNNGSEKSNVSGTDSGYYTCITYDKVNGKRVYKDDCVVEFTFVLNEKPVITPTPMPDITETIPVSVADNVWNYSNYGTFRSLNVKVNDTMYPLSKNGSSDITFHSGAKVKLLVGDSYVLWSGMANVVDSHISLSPSEDEEYYFEDYYFGRDTDTNAFTFYKKEWSSSGGGHGANAAGGGYKYDFKAQLLDGTPISGISVIDDTLNSGDEGFYCYEPGNTYTWGESNTFEYKVREGDEIIGVVTCRTNQDGIADMLMPLHPDNSWKDTIGETFYPCSSVHFGAIIGDDVYGDGNVYVNNGLVDIDTSTKEQETLDSLGISTTLKPRTDELLGDYYRVVEIESRGNEKVVLKDLSGKEIATVEMGIESFNGTKIDDKYYLEGEEEFDWGDIVPKVNVKMAAGMSNWKVDVNYEKSKMIFHIVATKNGEEESSENQSKEAKKIQLSKTSVTYNGKAQTPTVKVVDSEGQIILSDNYTVSYKNNKNVGQATVTVTMKGNYSGTLTANFTIKPQSTKISSVTAKKKGFALKWNKQTSQTDGYQIKYATNKKFTSAKTVLVNKNKTVAKTVSNLNAKKTYYVRVRTYKTVKVNGKNTKIYSGWSTAKKVVTK